MQLKMGYFPIGTLFCHKRSLYVREGTNHMHNRQSRGPQRPTIGQDVKNQLAEMQAQLDRIEWKIGRSFHGIMNTVEGMETNQMANFAELADKVSKIRGTVDSTKAFIAGLKAKIEELAAGMNDEEDQAAVAALATELGSTEADLAAAIVANPAPTDPPVEEPPVDPEPFPLPNPGGSTGGVGGSTGGV